MSKFKIVLTSIFGACIVIGIGLFAVSKGVSSGPTAQITVWGTIQAEAFDSILKSSSLKQNKQIIVTYAKKDLSTFDNDFIEALADGRGPDVVIMRDDSFYKHRNKIFVIPYKNYTERMFKDTFIEGGEVFLNPEGVIALPFAVDPMVMYWNRDTFSNNLVVNPPKYWEEVYPLINKITKKDNSANVTESALALGEWRNITNAKEIVAMLLMQAGTPIISRSPDGVYSVLNSQFDYSIRPSLSAINFYTQFSNPTGANYTWNRSLPSSLNFFLSGNLATYIGFASEISGIQQKNPNLNFDVTYVPQIKDTKKKIVFGHIYGLALVKQSKNISSAFAVISALTEPAVAKTVETVLTLPPVRKDLLSDKPTDAYKSVFYNSALLSHTWIDPDPTRSTVVFRDMIENITGGRARTTDALNSADTELGSLLR